MIVAAETVESLAIEFPNEQAAARLEFANIARRVGISPRIVTKRWMPEFGPFIERQSIIRPGELALLFECDALIVGVQIEIPRQRPWLVGGMTVHAAPLQNRLNVAKILDIDYLRRSSYHANCVV